MNHAVVKCLTTITTSLIQCDRVMMPKEEKIYRRIFVKNLRKAARIRSLSTTLAPQNSFLADNDSTTTEKLDKIHFHCILYSILSSTDEYNI